MRKVFSLFGTIGIEGVATVQRGLNAIDKQANELNRSLIQMGKGIDNGATMLGKFLTIGTAVFAGGALVAGMQRVIDKSIKLADQIDKQSKAFGLSTTAVQEWDYVLRQNGSSMDAAQNAFKTISQRAYDAASGNEAALKTFQALGIGVRDSNGMLKDADTLVKEVAFKLSGLTSTSERVAVATKLFGKSATELVPILSMTSDELQKNIEDAHTFGQVMSEDTIKRFDEAGDAAGRMDKALEVLGAELTVTFAPGITKITTLLTEATAAMMKFFGASNDTNFVKGKIASLSNELKSLEENIKTAERTGAKTVAWQGEREFRSAPLAVAKGEAAAIRSQISSNQGSSAPAGGGVTTTLSSGSGDDGAQKRMAEIAKYVEYAKQKEIELTQTTVEQIQIKKQAELDRLAVLKATPEQVAIVTDSFNLQIEAAQMAHDEKLRVIAEETEARKTELAAEAADEYIRIQEAKAEREAQIEAEITEEKDKLRAYEAERNQFFRDSYIGLAYQTADVFSQLYKNQAITIDNSLKKEIEAVNKSTLSQKDKSIKIQKLEEEAAKKKKDLQKKQANIDKGVAIFNAVINTAQAISKALTYGIPGIVLAVLMGAMGAAQIAMIAAEPLPLAEGGLVRKKEGGVSAVVGEGAQDELVLPMETGAMEIAKGIMANIGGGIREIINPSGGGVFGGQLAGAGAGGLSLHIGTFIGDERGLRELERRMVSIRTGESQRKGGD